MRFEIQYVHILEQKKKKRLSRLYYHKNFKPVMTSFGQSLTKRIRHASIGCWFVKSLLLRNSSGKVAGCISLHKESAKLRIGNTRKHRSLSKPL